MLLENNISALRQAQQEQLADLIKNDSNGHHEYRLVKGKTNKEVLLLKNESGHFVSTQSMYDPMRYNERKYPVESMKNASFIILMGLACEHDLLYALQNKRENAFIVVIEPSITLIRLALERVDCSELIRFHKISFFYQDLNEIDTHAGLLLTRPDILFMATHPYVMSTMRSKIRDTGYFDEVAKIFIKRANYSRLYLGNSIEDSLIGWRNIVQNLEHCIETVRFNLLKGKYEKKPAVVVATGPSLDKNINQLKQLEGKALIIATESAIVPLTKHNIIPDAIIVLERIPESYEYHFKGRIFHENTVLVALTMLDPRILQDWKHEKVLMFRENEFMNVWFRGLIGNQDGLSAGESVSTMGFDFANYLGCEPICFVGLDLAYSPEGVSHSKDSTYIAETDKTNQAFVNYIDKNPRIPIEDIFGNTIFTNELWLRFKDWLEVRLADKPDLCIDATEGGAYVKGTTVMPLRDVIQRIQDESVIPLKDTVRELNRQDNRDIEDDIQMLQIMKKQVNEHRRNMVDIVRKMRQVSKKQDRVINEINEDLTSSSISAESIEILNESKNVLNIHFIHDYALTLFFLQGSYAALYTKLNNIGLVNTRKKLLASVLLEQQYFQVAQDALRHRVLNEFKVLEEKVDDILKRMESGRE